MPRYADRDNSPSLEDGFGTTTDEGDVTDDKEWILRFKQSYRTSTDEQGQKLVNAWTRSYMAYNNRHFKGSKYEDVRYRNRTKLFKPKTREVVRKNDAAAASAFFSTEDVVNIKAERESDKLQATTARVIHEVLNYRLDRAHPMAGPNWFLTVVGARQEAQITGVCISKQFWEYRAREVEVTEMEEIEEPFIDPLTGMPGIDMETGAPLVQTVMRPKTYTELKVEADRPQIMLFPPEHVTMDKAGDWRDPIQEGGFLIVDYPTRRDDVQAIIDAKMDRQPMGGGRWREIDVSAVTRKSSDRQQAAAVRRARQDGSDQYETKRGSRSDDIIWLHECFYRVGGIDYHWWMLGDNIILSDPQPTEDAYPEQRGMRPYVRGLGAVETHKVHPMSVVESIQPLQMEANDIVNLRLDALKMSISPITLIKKGRGVDLRQVQNRGPDAHILVDNLDDIDFGKAPEPSQNAMMDINVISNDMDTLAGVFSGSSVQSNRTLNETVGGMQMLQGAASALTEFDLRVFAETWAEPVLRQIVNCIAYYENDEVILSVAGEKAGIIEDKSAMHEAPMMGHNGGPPMDPMMPPGPPPGMMPPGPPQGMPPGMPMPPQGPPMGSGLNPMEAQQQADQQTKPFDPPVTLDEVRENFDRVQLTIRINVGTGAMNPDQKLQRLTMAMKATAEMRPLLEEQGIGINAAAMLQEVWGSSGFTDAERFFVPAPKQDPGPPPEVQLKQMELESREKIEAEKLAFEREKLDREDKRIMMQAGAVEQVDPETGEPVMRDKLDVISESNAMQQDMIMQQITQLQQSIEMQSQINQQQQDMIAQQNAQMQQFMVMMAQQLQQMVALQSAPVVFDRDETGRLMGGRRQPQTQQ